MNLNKAMKKKMMNNPKNHKIKAKIIPKIQQNKITKNTMNN